MSYQHRVYRTDGTWWVDEFRDDSTRTVTTYNEAGAITGTRPYTAAESAAADASDLARFEETNRASIEAKATTALDTNATFLALTSPTNAQNATQVKALTRQCTALIRLALHRLETDSDARVG